MELYFNKEGKEKLIKGINKLNDAVASTMGPNGKTVIIPSDKEFGKYIVTKDGVSVARSVKFKDSVENIGAQLVREAAENTVKEAGDGTTTATVLATAFINNLKDFEYKEVEKALNNIIPQVIKNLEDNSKKLNKEDIIHVAKISANGDEVIAKHIQKAFNHSNIVKIEESSNTVDNVELIKGMCLNTGYLSKHFETNKEKGISELDKPKVLIVEGKIESLKPYEQILQTISANGDSLLIITEHINDNLLRFLESNVLSQNIKLSVMKAPGFSEHRKNLLEDLCLFTKATMVYNPKENVPLNVLGDLQKVSLTHNKSILVKDDKINVDNLITILTNKLNQEKDVYNKELLQQRLDNLSGGISVIKVGGKTETEMKERYDRYDDAVRAVSCALEEGIVAGGGVALGLTSKNIYSEYNLKNQSIEYFIHKSIRTPQIIIENSTQNMYSVNTDMFKLNIVDPLKVTKTALLNAEAVAKTILSTKAIVLHETEWKS